MTSYETYDIQHFDEIVSRKNTHSVKWSGNENELPMWIADMDFKVCPAITDAIRSRLDHEIFGYSFVPEEFRDAVAGWWNRRHDTAIRNEWILYCTGVVPALSSIIRGLTRPQDKIVILSPVYNAFGNVVRNNGRRLSECDLIYEDGIYRIDYRALEQQLSDPDASLCIFCNPHNPIGKIWSLSELEQVAELCLRHGVRMISDEIHCDLAHPNHRYTPALRMHPRLLDNLIVCAAPTKTFNIAGIHVSAIIVPNPELRSSVERGFEIDELVIPNVFSASAAIAAFRHGEPWLNALREYLHQNRALMETYLKENIPELFLVPSDASYLAWIDCRAVAEDTAPFALFLEQTTGLKISAGGMYGKSGQSFVRLNYACPRSVLLDGLGRLTAGTKQWKSVRS